MEGCIACTEFIEVKPSGAGPRLVSIRFSTSLRSYSTSAYAEDVVMPCHCEFFCTSLRSYSTSAYAGDVVMPCHRKGFSTSLRSYSTSACAVQTSEVSKTYEVS